MIKYSVILFSILLFPATVLFGEGSREDNDSQTINTEPIQETASYTFYMANGEELQIYLPVVETLSGSGEDTVIVLDMSEKVKLNLKDGYDKGLFTGLNIEKSESILAPHLFVMLNQPYDEVENQYSSASVYLHFRLKGYTLRCDLEVYMVDKENWQKIGQMVLPGDRKSDQIFLNRIVARMRLSNFKLAES